MNRQELLNVMRARLGTAIVGERVTDNDLWVRVECGSWAAAAGVAKTYLGMTYFSFLSAIDWQPNPDLDGERVFDPNKDARPVPDVITDPEVRATGGSSRFQVFARIGNVTEHTELTLVTDVDDSLTVPSWTPVFRGADWHERETWEMYGIKFSGHPELRHIYLPEDFEGFPLRKDFPLLARVVRPWPGLVDMEEMPPDDMEEMPSVEAAEEAP